MGKAVPGKGKGLNVQSMEKSKHMSNAGHSGWYV